MKIAVIGVTGMLGHHAVNSLLERGHEVTLVHRATSDLTRLDKWECDRKEANLDDYESLKKAFSGADVVLNCASYYPTVPKPWKNEVAYALSQLDNFLQACIDNDVSKIVYLGASIALKIPEDGSHGHSSSVHETRPENNAPYVQVKWEMDRYLMSKAMEGLPIVIAIPTMTFGEYDYGPSTGQLLVEVANGTMPGYVNGNRNIVYAGDAGYGLALACEKGRIGQRYLITGHNVSMKQLVETVSKISGVRPPKAVPLFLAKFINKLQEWKYYRSGVPPKVTSTAIAVMASGQFIEDDKASVELGYQPEESIEGLLARSINWFKEEGVIK